MYVCVCECRAQIAQVQENNYILRVPINLAEFLVSVLVLPTNSLAFHPFLPPAGPFFTLSRIQFSWLSLLFTLVQFSPHFHQKFFGSPVTNSSEVSHSQGQFSGEKVIPWLGKKQYRTHTPGGG